MQSQSHSFNEMVVDEGPGGLAAVRRLHLGASRLENFPSRALDVLINDSWLHLGDAERSTSLWTALVEKSRSHGPVFVLRNGFGSLRKLIRTKHKEPADLYRRTHFQPWFYEKGDSLPLPDESIDFIYSEQFLVALYLDGVVALLRECRRVLKPNGIIRTCVPDADLRTNEPPEMVGYPGPRCPWSDPGKSKTRFSVYSLTEILSLVGFAAVPIQYHDKFGEYHVTSDEELARLYAGCPDREMPFRRDYLLRSQQRQLIVDGVKTLAPVNGRSF
jgi:predicted SAM-dependent methyltransferase